MSRSSSHFQRRAGMAAAALSLTAVLAAVTTGQAQQSQTALSDWTYVGTYTPYPMCEMHGDLGQQNGDWVWYMCRGGSNLWVRYP